MREIPDRKRTEQERLSLSLIHTQGEVIAHDDRVARLERVVSQIIVRVKRLEAPSGKDAV
jgi:hypothetical protein